MTSKLTLSNCIIYGLEAILIIQYSITHSPAMMRRPGSGSMDTRHALRMHGKSLFVTFTLHIRHISFRILLWLFRWRRLSRMDQSRSSPWPIRPNLPMTSLHGMAVLEIIAMRKSQSLLNAMWRTETFFLLFLYMNGWRKGHFNCCVYSG